MNVLTEKSHEMIWHQRLIHLSPSTIKEAYKHVDGFPNLSWFDFDYITNFKACTKANLRKNSPTKWSLSKMVTYPYQGLFIDFGLSGQILYYKEGKFIPYSWVDIEWINSETAWILISDAQTNIYHGDTWLNKALPIKYL